MAEGFDIGSLVKTMVDQAGDAGKTAEKHEAAGHAQPHAGTNPAAAHKKHEAAHAQLKKAQESYKGEPKNELVDKLGAGMKAIGMDPKTSHLDEIAAAIIAHAPKK